jgi:TRAP-type C4-dicarboxylate transport system permease small subunit
MNKLFERLNRSTESFSGVLLALITTIVFLQVVFRYVLKITAPWTEETARYVGIWMVYAGALAATLQDDHIKVTVLTDRFGDRGKLLFSLFASLVGLVLCVIVFRGSLELIRMNWKQNAVTIPVSIAVLYLPLTVFSGISFVALLLRAGKSIGGVGSPSSQE